MGFTLGMGAGSHVSRSLGQNEQESAQQVAVTALLFAVVLGFALLVPGLFLAAGVLLTFHSMTLMMHLIT